MRERLCPVCNTIYTTDKSRPATSKTCSTTCESEIRRGQNSVQLDDGDQDFADDDLEGAFLEDSTLAVDGMMAALTGVGPRSTTSSIIRN